MNFITTLDHFCITQIVHNTMWYFPCKIMTAIPCKGKINVAVETPTSYPTWTIDWSLPYSGKFHSHFVCYSCNFTSTCLMYIIVKSHPISYQVSVCNSGTCQYLALTYVYLIVHGTLCQVSFSASQYAFLIDSIHFFTDLHKIVLKQA